LKSLLRKLLLIKKIKTFSLKNSLKLRTAMIGDLIHISHQLFQLALLSLIKKSNN